jgi:CDP-diacylglycerol--serine O-phosphatidyltransferase
MILANSLHMVFVKNNYFEQLAIPISEKKLGKNKTIRGFVLLPILSGVLSLIGSFAAGPFHDLFITDFFIGFGMGIIYLLAELPNSYMKRKLGISNGEYSEKYKVLQIIIDRADSLIAIFIYYYFVTSTPLSDCVIMFVWAMVLSFITSFILYSFKIKRSI